MARGSSQQNDEMRLLIFRMALSQLGLLMLIGWMTTTTVALLAAGAMGPRICFGRPPQPVAQHKR